jgi:hypothetical protein
MLDWLNGIACLVLMGLMAPIAKTFNHHRYWGQRIAFTAIVILLGLQVAAPIFEYWFLPEANYLQTLFNLIAIGVVLTAKKEIMQAVRSSVGTPLGPESWIRRASDKSPRDMDNRHLAGIRGRGIGQ